MDVVLLYNQKAGDGDRSIEDVAALLRRHGYRPESISMERAWADIDPLERGEFVVVAGGDGTVRRVATRVAHRAHTLALLPMGTANNIATSLGVTGELDEIVAGWKNGPRRRADLGYARGPWGERYFIEGVGLGLIGRAIHTLDGIDQATHREFSSREDKLYRDLCILYSIASEMPPVAIGVAQDQEDRTGRYLLLEILNISHAGPGFELARSADPFDGWLDVVSVRSDERAKLQNSLVRCLAELDHGTILESQRARKLTLELRSGEVRIDDQVVWPPPGDQRASPGDEPVQVEVGVERGLVEFVLPQR